ncbi:hypothetical protein fugu_006348, partial [Takifugu bimaculatus]
MRQENGAVLAHRDKMNTIGRIGVLILWMHTLTLVRSKDCQRESFLSSRLYDSNFDISTLDSTYADRREVRVPCNIGHSGFFKLVCNNGEWTSKGKPCRPISCGHPGDAQFAEFQLVEGEDFVFGSKVVYTCHKGYQMVSRINYRRCFVEGWDGVVPVCEAQQCPFIRVDNNVFVNGDPEEATFGNVIRFSCKSKLDILEGPSEIYCNEEGEWSGRAPKCIEKLCNRPELMDANIRGAFKQSYSNNEKIQYDCTYSQEVHEAKCEEGVWTGITNCSACPKAVIPHGFAVGAQGDKLTYTCDEGYKLFNKGWWGEATCVNHQWSGLKQCIGERQCGEIPAIANGEALPIQKPDDENESTEIRCNEGFEAQVTSLSCHKGEWSSGGLPLNTICTARASNCGAPPKVDNAIITTTYKNNYLNNSKVAYECRNKYMLVGEGSLQCLDGKWEEKNITCA